MRRLLLAVGKAVVLVVLPPVMFVALVRLTGGLSGGALAAALTVAGAGALAWWWLRRSSWPGRLGVGLPTLAVCALCAWLAVPVASTGPLRPSADGAHAPTGFWDLPTGSRLAYYHAPPAPGMTAKPAPLLFVHGGPGGFVSTANLRFFGGLAAHGYDVYLYDQAGGGHSTQLPDDQYSHQRNVEDLRAVIERIGAPRVTLVGQSYGAQILASALADERLRARVDKAVFTEPAPYDVTPAPTAHPDYTPETAALDVYQRYPDQAERKPRILVGLMAYTLGLWPAGNRFLGQNESTRAFGADNIALQTAASYCRADAGRLPPTGPTDLSINLKANIVIQSRLAREARSLKADLARSTVPIMVMLGECSYVGRPRQVRLIADYPAVARVQYLPGVGHALWNGLDHNDERARTSLLEFLDGRPPTLPDYPNKADLDEFLRARK